MASSSSADVKVKSPHELLGMETALLIATAASRKIDVSVWFGEKASDGKILVRDFDSKIMSLASAMGINQDPETKRELELATSTLALRMVHTLCAAGEDEHGQIFIDVSYFFKLCQEKVDKYLAEIEEEPEEDDEPATASVPVVSATENVNFREWKEGAYDIQGNPIDVPESTVQPTLHKVEDHEEDSYNSEFEYRPHDEDSEDYDIVHLSAEDYITDLKAKVNEPRPKSAPVGGRALSRGETINETFQPTEDDEPLYTQAPSSPSLHIRMTEGMHWNESKITPASPYDEEVEFGDEDDDFDSKYMKSRGSNKLNISLKPGKVGAEKISKDGKVTNPDDNTDWNEENRRFLMVSKEKTIKPRPSSAPRMSARNTAPASTSNTEPAGQPARSKSTERMAATSRRSLAPPTNTINRSESPKRRTSISNFGPHLKKSKDLPLTLDQMVSLKDVVEDLARDTVKKTDCYHLIQVSLGYIDSYTMVPPRGAIVMSTKREWLTNREIHSAFISGRLFLQDNHIKALKLLVNDFAKQYRKMYVDKANKMIKLQDELEEKLPGHVFGPGHALSAEWLKRYLVHLRLTKRTASHQSNKTLLNTSSIASKSIGLMDTSDNNIKASGNDDKSEGSQDFDKVPIMWKEWLAKKLKLEIERGPMKPKDFQRALNGQNHPLNKDDIEYLLKSHPILTQEALMQEIEYRIESWVLDSDGRRDFQHQLNVKIRTWIWDEMVLSKAAKLPKNEHGYWRIWQHLPEEKRKEVKESLIKKLVDEKREELKSAERTRMEITRSLFWQFDAARKDRECPWTEWLPNHLEKFRKNLDKFKKNEEERTKIASKQKKRRKSMASLQAIETNLKDVGKSLDAHHQMQLQKGIVSLRRAARENGLGKGGIITKEDFDAHIKGILEPYISLNDTFIENYTMDPNAVPTNLTKFAEEWRNKINALFTSDPDLTLQRATEDTDNYNNTNKVSYKKWLEDKKKRQQEEERRKEEEKEREERDKQMRKKKSEKAFKKWLRLRKQNKYKSMVDNKTHDLPEARRADHYGRWNYDKESIPEGVVEESNPKLNLR